jgi:HlyD family secretion protein
MTSKRIPWRYLVPAFALVAIVALALKPTVLPVEAATLSKGPMQVTIDEEGRTEVKRRYIVSAPLAGKLLRIALEAGDPVAEGAVLARLVPADAPLIDPRSRAESEARLHAAEAQAAQASANVARAQVDNASAHDDLARKQKLAKGAAISAHDLDVAESDAAARVQDLASAQFGAKVAEHNLAEARAALARGRSGRLDELDVVAPAAGRVLRVMHQSEGVVSAGTELLEVGDPSALEITSDLLSSQAVRVKPGMPAFIDHWGGDKPLEARVRSVDPSGFTKLSALGVEEQRVRVVLDLASPPSEWRALGDHYRVEVHIIAWQSDSVLRAPTAALFRRGPAWAAFAIESGRARLRTLTLGEQSPDEAEVLSGAHPGDPLILRPPESLHDGARVTLPVLNH